MVLIRRAVEMQQEGSSSKFLAFKHLGALTINKPSLVWRGHSWKHAQGDAQPSQTSHPGDGGNRNSKNASHRSVPWRLRNAVELPLSFV